MARICTILTCIHFGKVKNSGNNINSGSNSMDLMIDDNNFSFAMRWKRRLDLLLASCQDIPSKYADSLSIVGYVSCNCISNAIGRIQSAENSNIG